MPLQFSRVKRWLGALLLGIFSCYSLAGRAEGSKELNSNGGSRAFLVSGTTPTASFLFPTNGTMKVYAKAGETIYVGSSVQGINSGTINLRAPNGGTFTSGSSTTIGRINNRTQEVAGPLPNAGGYTPYTHVVQPGEDGVWEVDFIAENGGVPATENPNPIAASANWTQFPGPYIVAFDISVRNTGNTAFLTGRVFTNIFSGILGAYDVGFNAVFKVLTKDGYIYNLDNNGQAGNGFSFFVNNKGFRKADGTPSYLSVNSVVNPNIQDPRTADTETDITYKLFFNTPAADLPATANAPGGTTAWLLTSIASPTLSAVTFTGREGTPGKGGVGMGGTFAFTTNRNGTYNIVVDVNKNGVYTDAIDRKLTDVVRSGVNTVDWDGLDGLGNTVPAGSNYSTSVAVTLFGGEVHFPFFDVERNINGIKLTRLNGDASPDFTVYWDDTPLPNTGTPSNPRKNTTGLNSQLNGHKWGTAGTTPSDFGDEKSIDTWSYMANVALASNLNLQLQQADLEVGDINGSTAGGCIGQQITYTFTVKNNGPNDVTGAKFSFAFPADLTDVKISHVATTGTSAVSGETTTTTGYAATFTMANGAVRTYTVTGKVATQPASGSVEVTASILRTADVSDPDATNPDSAPPTDASAECNSAPSGTGCNNIKVNKLAFISPPDAGADQTVFINETATITAVGTGTWTQNGSTPALATIASPTTEATTITGLNTIGIYSFIRSNANGCTDTVTVTVVPKTINIPTVITPNNDGSNDTFTIPNISLFPGSQLYIYNRWGGQVFKSENYQNTWDGGTLAEGTYYYVLNRKEPSGSYTSFKGWVFLKR